jgi:hypothetical protein
VSGETGGFGRPEAVPQNAMHPLAAAIFSPRRRPAPSPPVPGMRRFASGSDQRLWMSIAGRSSDDA